MVFYTLLIAVTRFASGYLKRSTREAVYFSGFVCWFVFQSMYMYDWHYLYADMPEPKPDEVQEESPSILYYLYIVVYAHYFFIYLVVITLFTCGFCAIIFAIWNYRQRQNE